MLYRHLARRDERGQILVLFAAALVLILLCGALVVDLGMLRNDRQTLVNTMDAAALAGGTQMPVDGDASPQGSASGGQWDLNQKLIQQTVAANFPSLVFGVDYTIEYRCLIGVDPSGDPYISRDIPWVCSPSGALGHSPVASDFVGAGPTRNSPCDPTKSFLGVYDKCNVVVVRGVSNTPYVLGPVVGILSGNTGIAESAACRGPCGEPPSVPVDLVVIIDRTASMSASDVQATRDAAKAVLGAYDPDVQRVALGLLGPSQTNSSCGVPAVNVNTYTGSGTTSPSYASSTTNATSNTSSSLLLARPAGTSSGDFLLAQVLFNSGSNLSVSPPAGWSLARKTTIGTTTLGQAIYYKVAGTSEPSSYIWSFGSSVEAAGGILRYTGVDTATPFSPSAGNGSIGSGNTGSGSTLTASSINTTNTNTRIVTFFGHENDTSLSTPFSMTERYEKQQNNSGQDLTVAVDDDNVSSSGSTGNKSSSAGSSNNWIAQMVALKPAPGAQPYGTDPNVNLGMWIPIGLTGTGAPGYDEPYVDSLGGLNNSSHIVSAINCFDAIGGTGTNLASPVAMATYYLQKYGRPGVKWGIILETDGQPNYSSTGDSTNYTCYQAANEAMTAKAAGIEMFTIGFGLDGSNNANCPDGSGTKDNSGKSWYGQKVTSLLAAMATTSDDNLCTTTENTDLDHFFCEPKSSDLTHVFTTVATQFANINSHLVQLYPKPIVSGLSPSAGSASGGDAVTITGAYFSGATKVTFGGKPASFTVMSDTTIVAVSPSGSSGNTVDILVTTGGGTSSVNVSDRYTYTP
jgi:IPT/TIG domain/Putative Flp pilus-assembly TadE/G-like